VGLNGTAKDRADLDVVLVVLAELHNAGVSAVMRVRERMACDSKEVLQHAREDSVIDSEGGYHRHQDIGQGCPRKATLEKLGPIKWRRRTTKANKVLCPQKFTKVTGRVLAVGQARELEQRILRRRRASVRCGPVGLRWSV